MKFFTPELYLQYNSANDAEADRADAAWEQALHQYESHLKKLANDMPPRVKELAWKWCLHDAELLSVRNEESEPFALRFQLLLPFLPIALVALRQEENSILLVYLLWKKVRETKPCAEWRFSAGKQYWLYDEIDVDNRCPGLYWHRILLSDGTILELPFFDVFIEQFAATTVASGGEKARGDDFQPALGSP